MKSVSVILITINKNLTWTNSKTDQEKAGLILRLNFWKSSMVSKLQLKIRCKKLKTMKSSQAPQLLNSSFNLNTKSKSTSANSLRRKKWLKILITPLLKTKIRLINAIMNKMILVAKNTTLKRNLRMLTILITASKKTLKKKSVFSMKSLIFTSPQLGHKKRTSRKEPMTTLTIILLTTLIITIEKYQILNSWITIMMIMVITDQINPMKLPLSP